jgi:hypothetical protein
LFKDSDFNKSIECLEDELRNRFIDILKVGNIDDKQRLSVYIKSIFKVCNNDYDTIKLKLTTYFSDITLYKDKKEKKFKKKLKKVNFL